MHTFFHTLISLPKLSQRYNISTNDYDGWNTNATLNAEKGRLQDGAKVSLAEKYGFASDAVARNRGYIFKNNPEVKLFEGADFTLRLAVNTAQYGRVFQDRLELFVFYFCYCLLILSFDCACTCLYIFLCSKA